MGTTPSSGPQWMWESKGVHVRIEVAQGTGPSSAFWGPRALKILGARDTKIGLQNIKNKNKYSILRDTFITFLPDHL